jgi:hypothetical protein
MPNPWLNEHKSTAAMNYFLILCHILCQTTLCHYKIANCNGHSHMTPTYYVVMLEWFYTEIMKYTCNVIKDQLRHKKIHYVILIKLFMQTFWNSSDRRTERAENHKDRQIFLLVYCILFCIRNRKCNWYAGTITVNSELDSASNDIYFLNMQLFPW